MPLVDHGAREPQVGQVAPRARNRIVYLHPDHFSLVEEPVVRNVATLLRAALNC